MIIHPRVLTIVASLLGTLAIAALPMAAQAAAGQAATGCETNPAFRAGDFSRQSIDITNKWLPLKPGMQFTLEGHANSGGGVLPHTVVLTVTDVTKTIAGVQTVVLWDRDFEEGQLTEAELAFHAQDRVGNVWGLGEYPEEYDNGSFAGAPNTWITGQAKAHGGYAIQADPRLGTPGYLQGIAPSIDFLDCARVFAQEQKVCVPVKCYDHVLVTDETSPLAGTAHQRKFYAAGVGNVEISAVNDPEGETLVLAKLVQLDKHALNLANEAALKLDRHGYRVSDVYRHTPPALACIELPFNLPSVSVGVGNRICP